MAEDRVIALLRELSTLGEPAREQRVETFLKDASDEERGGFAALLMADWQPEFDRSPMFFLLRAEWERRKNSDWAHWARRAATPPRKADDDT